MLIQDFSDGHMRNLGNHLPSHQAVGQLAQRPLVERLAERARRHRGNFHHHGFVFRRQLRRTPRTCPSAQNRQSPFVVLADQLANLLLMQMQCIRDLLDSHALGAERDQLPTAHLHGVARPLQPPSQFLRLRRLRRTSMETHSMTLLKNSPYVPMIPRLTTKYKLHFLTEH